MVYCKSRKAFLIASWTAHRSRPAHSYRSPTESRSYLTSRHVSEHLDKTDTRDPHNQPHSRVFCPNHTPPSMPGWIMGPASQYYSSSSCSSPPFPFFLSPFSFPFSFFPFQRNETHISQLTAHSSLLEAPSHPVLYHLPSPFNFSSRLVSEFPSA